MASSCAGVSRQASILLPAAESQKEQYSKFYNEHCHRIYSLVFWMTDNEAVAEQLASKTVSRAFASGDRPRTEEIDQAFLTEIRELTPVEALTLHGTEAPGIKSIYGNMKRTHLERAVVQLPATEKLIFLLHDVEGYVHVRISRLLGIREDEVKFGLHQVRLLIRDLVARIT
jgi:RNA polymerase sigma-70 factor (ECF subfamily)